MLLMFGISLQKRFGRRDTGNPLEPDCQHESTAERPCDQGT